MIKRLNYNQRIEWICIEKFCLGSIDSHKHRKSTLDCTLHSWQGLVYHTCHSQELQVNGTAVPYIQPFAQQMGMANGGKVGAGSGKYNEMARMAMSHPAFLNQAEQRPQVVFGSHSQFEVSWPCFDLLRVLYFLLSDRISRSDKCLRWLPGWWDARTSSTVDRSTTFLSSSELDRKSNL